MGSEMCIRDSCKAGFLFVNIKNISHVQSPKNSVRGRFMTKCMCAIAVFPLLSWAWLHTETQPALVTFVKKAIEKGIQSYEIERLYFQRAANMNQLFPLVHSLAHIHKKQRVRNVLSFLVFMLCSISIAAKNGSRK